MTNNQNIRQQQQRFPQLQVPVPDIPCKQMHAVKSGDTLYSISLHYDVPVSILMQVNHIINPYSLKIGQELCIPDMNLNMEAENNKAAPVCRGILHTIVAGDTLYLIAKKNDISLDALMDANPNVDPYNLRIGTKLCIPIHERQPAPAPAPPPAPAPAPPPAPVVPEARDVVPPVSPARTLFEPEEMAMGTYHIRVGDNLDNICDRLGMPMQNVMRANPSLSVMDFSVPGTRVNIPR